MSSASSSLIQNYINHICSNYKNAANHQIDCEPILKSFYISIATFAIDQSINEMVITKRGKRNFYVYSQIKEMKERFRQKERAQCFDENTLAPMNLVVDNMVTVKLEDDIDYIRHILTTTYESIILDGSYKPLNEIIANVNQESKNEYKLIMDHIRGKIEMDQLCVQIREESEESFTRLQDLKDAICNIQSDLSEATIDNHIKLRLVSKWEESRTEQAQRIFQQNEKTLAQTIDQYNVNIKREQIVIKNIESYNNLKIKQIEDQMTKWIQRYEEDTQRFDTEIKATKDKIDEVKAKYAIIHGKYAERQVELDAFYEEQRLLAEQRAYEENLCKKAIRIQAWWRGVMVRRQLGPYRPKKKGKKGKGKK